MTVHTRLGTAGSSRQQGRVVHSLRWALGVLTGLLAAAFVFAGAAAAQELKTFSKKASYDDVKFDLTNAITNRGLVVDFTGNVAGMLDRTGKDVGSAKKVYTKAEYLVFCSAKLSREMMEADAANAGFCPFIVFLYEAADKPGVVTVGYRQLPRRGKAASRKALVAINALLQGLAKDATK